MMPGEPCLSCPSNRRSVRTPFLRSAGRLYLDGMKAKAAETIPQGSHDAAIQTRAPPRSRKMFEGTQTENRQEKRPAPSPKSRLAETKRLVHMQLGRSSITRSEIGNEIAQDPKRYQPPVTVPIARRSTSSMAMASRCTVRYFRKGLAAVLTAQLWRSPGQVLRLPNVCQ